jgi:putative DNA primase/helicase
VLDAAEIKRRVPIETVVSHYGGSLNGGGKGRCLLPHHHTHGDVDPSMAVGESRVMCWSQNCFGEKGADVFELVGIMENLVDFPDQKRRVCEIGGIIDHTSSVERHIVATYDYTDETGQLLFQVVRFEPKDFRQRRPGANGGWRWNLKETRLVLYHLTELVTAETVLIMEGEKDVETAYRLGVPDGWAATCNPMGAGKWREEYSDFLKGKRVVILPDADEPGRNHGEQVAHSLHGKAHDILRLALPDRVKDLSQWAETGGTHEDFRILLEEAEPRALSPSNAQAIAKELAAGAVLVCLADVQPEAITWLWPGRIARGKLTLLVGDPGVGKSMLTMDLAARISREAPFPDGSQAPGGTVIILTAEDGVADTLRPRLDAMQGDPSRVFVMTGIRTSEDSTPGYFQLTTDLPHLEQAINEHNAVLVVIDRLSAYMGEKDSYKDAEVRRVLGPLAMMAERTGVAVVGIMHLNKNEQRKALYRALNSIAFVAAARAVFAVADDPDTEGRVLFLALKMNIAPKPPGLAYRLDGPRIAWDTEPVTADAESALRGTDLPEERAERVQAVEVLRELLQAGSIKAETVKKEAGVAGVSERTLYRAKAALRVKAHRVGGLGSTGWWEWELPESRVTPDPKTANFPKIATLLHRENVAALGDSGSLSSVAEEVFPIGARTEEAGEVEGHTTWNQYPNQTCYQVNGRTVPHSRVLGVEGKL